MRPEERLGTLGYNLREKGRKAGRDGATWFTRIHLGRDKQNGWCGGMDRRGVGKQGVYLSLAQQPPAHHGARGIGNA